MTELLMTELVDINYSCKGWAELTGTKQVND